MEKKNLKREAIILGALLHDIGKFVQRTQSEPWRQDHSKWGEEWFTQYLSEKLTPVLGNTKEIVRSAINNHHNSEVYISLSDSISAGMDRIEITHEEKGDPLTSPLCSIFSQISITDSKKEDCYYHLASIGDELEEAIFPSTSAKCSTKDYIKLFKKFNQEIEKIDFRQAIPDQLFDTLYFLLSKYTSCIPSATYKNEPDISLFDHLKTSAAIAACLYDYSQENKKTDIETDAFRLVKGDISGIQSYIFNVLSQKGKVAQRLRARSFFIQMISEIAAHKIIHYFNLSLCNIIASAGGNFYILLPNVKDAPDRLKILQRDFDKWTYENFGAEISLTLGTALSNGRQLGEFKNLLNDLELHHQYDKSRTYFSILTNDNRWKTDQFIFPEVVEGDEKMCSSCGRHPIINEEKLLCKGCDGDIRLGRLLPKANFISFYKNQNKVFPIFDYSFEIHKDLPDDASSYLVYALNKANYSNIGYKYLTNYIPTTGNIKCENADHEHEEGKPVFFDCIAHVARGDKLLGVLKGDVDNMGRIFRDGFKETKYSISRFVSLSRMLDMFFSGFLQLKLEKDFPEMYTVFSGGDDFFFVGPWDRIIDFSREIRKEFSRFTGGNPDFTFSAAVILARPHEPVSFYSESAEQGLEKAKHFSKDVLNKDKITFFGEILSWGELDKVLKEAERIIHWLEGEPPLISRGFIYNLRRYGEMNEEYKKTGNTKYLKFVPLLAYDVSRNLTGQGKEEVKDWTSKLSPLIQKEAIKDNLPFLRIIMEYVLTYTRGKKHDKEM